MSAYYALEVPYTLARRAQSNLFPAGLPVLEIGPFVYSLTSEYFFHFSHKYNLSFSMTWFLIIFTLAYEMLPNKRGFFGQVFDILNIITSLLLLGE